MYVVKLTFSRVFPAGSSLKSSCVISNVHSALLILKKKTLTQIVRKNRLQFVNMHFLILGLLV